MKNLGVEVAQAELTAAEVVAASAFVDLYKQATQAAAAIKAAKDLTSQAKAAFQESLQAIEKAPKNDAEAKLASLSIEMRQLQEHLEAETRECKSNTEMADAAFKATIELGHDGSSEEVVQKHNAIICRWQDLEEAKTDYKLRVGSARDALREAKAKTAEAMSKKAKQLNLF